MGNAYSMLRDIFFPGQPDWSVDQVPDLTGQVIIVTGYLQTTTCLDRGTDYKYYRGNTGIGRETCKVRVSSYILTFHEIYPSVPCRYSSKKAQRST